MPFTRLPALPSREEVPKLESSEDEDEEDKGEEGGGEEDKGGEGGEGGGEENKGEEDKSEEKKGEEDEGEEGGGEEDEGEENGDTLFSSMALLSGTLLSGAAGLELNFLTNSSCFIDSIEYGTCSLIHAIAFFPDKPRTFMAIHAATRPVRPRPPLQCIRIVFSLEAASSRI